MDRYPGHFLRVAGEAPETMGAIPACQSDFGPDPAMFTNKTPKLLEPLAPTPRRGNIRRM
jgi:hypothetical protein